MAFKHFTLDDRLAIAYYRNLGLSVAKIGELIGRTFVSVFRELQRNSVEGVYCPQTAHALYQKRMTSKSAASKFTDELKVYLETRLRSFWSPEEISGQMKREQRVDCVSFKTIYRWFYDKKLLNGSKMYLRRKGKRYNYTGIVGRIKNTKSIHDRPIESDLRLRLGDWEVDTVESPKGKKACIVTLVDRKSRFLKAALSLTRRADDVNQVIISLLEDEPVYTITSDNGKEFTRFVQVEEALNVSFYFADPYSSWQRGTNENTNGLLREFFPKGTDFSKISVQQLAAAVYSINHRPCKLHGFKTRFEVYHE